MTSEYEREIIYKLFLHQTVNILSNSVNMEIQIWEFITMNYNRFLSVYGRFLSNLQLFL